MNENMSRTERATHQFLVFAFYTVYSLAVIYGDMLFLQVVSKTFSHDPLQLALTTAGAVMTAASAILLPIAKSRWIMPGPQTIIAFIFWLVEIGVLALNAMVAYGESNSFTNMWAPFVPTTPFIAAIGWGLLLMTDPRNIVRHSTFEGIAESLTILQTKMRETLNSTAMHDRIEAKALQWGEKYVDETLPRLLGLKARDASATPREDEQRAPSAMSAPRSTVAPTRKPQEFEPTVNGNGEMNYIVWVKDGEVQSCRTSPSATQRANWDYDGRFVAWVFARDEDEAGEKAIELSKTTINKVKNWGEQQQLKKLGYTDDEIVDIPRWALPEIFAQGVTAGSNGHSPKA